MFERDVRDTDVAIGLGAECRERGIAPERSIFEDWDGVAGLGIGSGEGGSDGSFK